MPEPKFCKKCGCELKVETKHVGFDESTGKPVNIKLKYCPMIVNETILKAHLDGTLCLGGYYHGHYLQESE